MTTAWFCLMLVIMIGIVNFGYRKPFSTKAYIAAGVVGIIMTFSYYAFLENIFARKFGGTLDVSIPKDEYLIGISWKNEDSWILTYDSVSKNCYYREESKFSTLEGKIRVSNCKPLILHTDLLELTK
jgi:hypothetical protein